MDLTFHTTRQGMRFCIGQFFGIAWRWSGKLLTRSTWPRSWSLFSDLMTCSLSLGWLFSFFNSWLYTSMVLFLLGHSLIFGLCSNGNLAIIWWLVRPTFTDWLIMSFLASLLCLLIQCGRDLCMFWMIDNLCIYTRLQYLSLLLD